MNRPAFLLDLRDWAILRITGPDAHEFLQGVGTQEVAALPDGAALPTLFLTDKGRPVALAWAMRERAEGSFRLFVEAGGRDAILPHLERLRVMEDVTFERPGAAPRLYGVAGDDRDRAAREWAGAIGGGEVVAADPATFLVLPTDARLERPDGAKAPRAPLSPEEAEAWRLTVGIPRAGVDFDLERIATELSYPEAISLTKGCFVGQEVVARTTHRGAARRRRVGFRYDGSAGTLARGTEIRAAGKAVGFVTSTAVEPGTGRGLGMGYLATEAPAGPGDLAAGNADPTTPIEVAPWPL